MANPKAAPQEMHAAAGADLHKVSGAQGRAVGGLLRHSGGRWYQETAQFLRGFALFQSDGKPEFLRERVKLAWLRRW